MRRIHCGPARWHVFARGTRRLQLFRDEQDYGTVLKILFFALRQSGCELWAYALMSNHYHFVLFGSSKQLTECMYQINKLYAQYHNKRYQLGGHVFDGPYQAVRIPTAATALWTLAYVYLNPVKAGLCTAPEEYRWSGYVSFMGGAASPLEISSASIMSRMDLPVKQAWDLFHGCIRRQKENPPRQVPGRPSMIEVHRSQFEWLQQQAETSAQQLSKEDRQLLAIHWARRCGITPRVIAMELNEADPAEIRRRLYRFRKRLAEDRAMNSLWEGP